MSRKDFIDKFINKLDRVDGGSIRSLLRTITKEKGLAERIFDSIFEGIVVIDEGSNIIFYNRADRDLLAWPRDAMIGRRIEGGWLRDMAGESKAGGEGVTRMQVPVERGRIFDLSSVPLYDNTGNPIGTVVLFRDISDDRRWEAVRRSAARMEAFASLAAGVAHEIGNPLSSLDLYMQLIERDLDKLPPGEGGDIREYVGIAKDEIGRLDYIVKQFLRAARPMKPRLGMEDLNEIVESTLRFMEHEISKGKVRVVPSYAAEVPGIYVDRSQVRQAFFNILKNALQAMPDGGELRATTVAGSGEVSISFTDTGGGIRPEDFGRIFEPYFTTREEGSGLGLMIVRKIIRANGGRIEVENVTLPPDGKRGTRFTVRFPIGGRYRRMLPEKRQTEDRRQ